MIAILRGYDWLNLKFWAFVIRQILIDSRPVAAIIRQILMIAAIIISIMWFCFHVCHLKVWSWAWGLFFLYLRVHVLKGSEPQYTTGTTDGSLFFVKGPPRLPAGQSPFCELFAAMLETSSNQVEKRSWGLAKDFTCKDWKLYFINY